jgi:hypothetical protein
VGIDLGLTDLMTYSNGEKRKPITRLTKIESQIAKNKPKTITEA